MNPGTNIVIDEKYKICVPNCDLFLVEIAATAEHRSAKFEHPNIARTVKRKLEFKHHHANGSKSWSSQDGVSHYFAIRAEDIEIIPEKGYSYVKTRINGEEITLNVSGGTTDNGGWADFFSEHVSTCVNVSLKTLKAVAEVAKRGTHFEPVKTHEEIEEEFYRENAGRWMVTSAFGDWHENVPKGMVGVFARVNGGRNGEREEKCFMIPDPEYKSRGFHFIIDTDKYKEVSDFTK